MQTARCTLARSPSGTTVGGWFKAGVGDFSDSQLLMVSLLSGDDWSISGQWEMDPWVWHQVGLELSQIHIQGTIETQRCSDGRHNLSNQSVKIGVSWTLNVKVAT